MNDLNWDLGFSESSHRAGAVGGGNWEPKFGL